MAPLDRVPHAHTHTRAHMHNSRVLSTHSSCSDAHLISHSVTESFAPLGTHLIAHSPTLYSLADVLITSNSNPQSLHCSHDFSIFHSTPWAEFHSLTCPALFDQSIIYKQQSLCNKQSTFIKQSTFMPMFLWATMCCHINVLCVGHFNACILPH